MKRIIYLIVAVGLVLGGCAKNEAEKTGDIYGVITDKATGELINAAGVQLSTGAKTVTGSEGQYEFDGLDAGDYNLQVTKTGYADLAGYKITVTPGKTTKGDVQLEKLPPSLRVVDDNKQDISELNFGEAAADVTRSFNIFNDGYQTLQWEITVTANWITGVSKASGTLNAGATQAIVVTIDRTKLAGGDNITTIQITSNNGSKQLTIKTTGETKVLATLNTLAATTITSSSATLNGEILNSGTPAYTERGFVYSLSSMPTVETTIKKVTASVTENKTYSAAVSGLALGQTYYVRAYAINTVGTAYSTNDVNFKTVMSLPEVTTQEATNKNIGAGTATFNGTIINAGDPGYTERGFVYGLVHNPSIESDTKKSVSGTGTGVFSSNLTGLTVGNVYYVRAYATNASGTAYGSEIVCDFTAVMPVVSTQAVTNISSTTATFNGAIVSAGDPAYTEKGFVYSTTNNPTISDTKKVVSGSGTGAFSANITGLFSDTKYYVRAYVTSSKGTIYGEEVNFVFTATLPVVSTQAVTNINATTATFNGTVVNTGDPAYTERGFVYSTNNNPSINDTKKVVSGSGAGIFSANITGLTSQTIYYVKAYATNIKGTVYGEEVSFTPSSPDYFVLKDAGIMVQKKDISSTKLTWANAVNMCRNSTVGGYNDWRLPTVDELIMMYDERNTIGGFSTTPYNDDYWTSTFYGYTYLPQQTPIYDFVLFRNGEIEADCNSHFARAVRSLP